MFGQVHCLFTLLFPQTFLASSHDIPHALLQNGGCQAENGGKSVILTLLWNATRKEKWQEEQEDWRSVFVVMREGIMEDTKQARELTSCSGVVLKDPSITAKELKHMHRDVLGDVASLHKSDV